MVRFRWERFPDDESKRRYLNSAMIVLNGPRQAARSTAKAAAAASADGDAPRGGGANVPLLESVPPAELSDHRPAFGAVGVRADMDGRLWVRTIGKAGVVYDVIDRTGQLVQHVKTPPSYVIIGFGPNGVVYLGARRGADVHLLRSRLK